jgi:hypothetical protein
VKTIELTQGKVALVDDEDFEVLNQVKWYAFRDRLGRLFYARRSILTGKVSPKCRALLMHRLIMPVTPGMEVDHIDGDGLNNQKSNLRICTHSENMRNQGVRPGGLSRYKGMYVERRYAITSYRGKIVVDGKQSLSKRMNSPEEAALWYDYMALKHFGEFAKLNFDNRNEERK